MPDTAVVLSPVLVAEATRRSGVVWVDGRLVWHLWHVDAEGGAAYVVGGEGEQPLPAAPGDRVEVLVRSKASQSGVVVVWTADVGRVEPGSARWDEVVPLLLAERLHAAPDAAERWARECTVLRLVPV